MELEGRILLTWIGGADRRAAAPQGAPGTDGRPGPIARAIDAVRWSRVVLLDDERGGEAVVTSLKSRPNCPHVERREISLLPDPPGPMGYTSVFRAVRREVKRVRSEVENPHLAYLLNPGTMVMQWVWVLISRMGYPAALVDSNVHSRTVTAVDLPFDLVSRFVGEEVAGESIAEFPPPTATFDTVVRSGPEMEELVRQASWAARFDLPVLITGESGTGKELFARAIHNTARPQQPFVAVNCGAIPTELFESELFGHVKGAFTGAVKERVGKLKEAGAGTLFLDEVGDLPLAMQAKLLRALADEGRFTAVGARSDQRFGAQVIAATNRDLLDKVRDGSFRDDLFYRLAGVILHLPPLCDRAGDVDRLLDAHLAECNAKHASVPGYRAKHLSPGARRTYLEHRWPGNVRELRHTVGRVVAFSPGPEIRERDARQSLLAIPGRSDALFDKPVGDGFSLDEVLGTVEQHFLKRALEQAGGSQSRAAELLGLNSHTTFANRWEKRFGEPPPSRRRRREAPRKE